MPYPFDRSGTEVGADGIRRYTGLPQNLLQLLRGLGRAASATARRSSSSAASG